MFAFVSKKKAKFAFGSAVFLIILFMLCGSAFATLEADFLVNLSQPLHKVSVKVDGQMLDSEEKTQPGRRLVLHLFSSNYGDYNGPPFEVDLEQLLFETERQGCELKNGKNEWDMIHQGGYDFLIDCHTKPPAVQTVHKSYLVVYIAIFVGSVFVVIVVLFYSHKLVDVHPKLFIDNYFSFQTHQNESESSDCPVVENAVFPKRKKKRHKKVVKKPGSTVFTLPAAILQQLNPPKQKADWQLKLDSGKPLTAEDLLNKELDEAEKCWQPILREEKRKRRFFEQAVLKPGEKRQPTPAEIAYKKLKNEAIERYTKQVYRESMLTEQYEILHGPIKQEPKNNNKCLIKNK